MYFLLILQSNYLAIAMGCHNSANLEHRRAKYRQSNRISRHIGVFQVKIKSILLYRSTENSQNLSGQILKLQASNQSQEYVLTDLCFEEGSETVCNFYINSDWKESGRMMTVEVLNHKKEDPNIGIGIFDLQPYFLPRSKKGMNLNLKDSDTKCYLNYEHYPAGFIQIEVNYHEQPYRELSIQLRSLKVQKQLKGVNNYFARVTIGEEEHDTQVFKIQRAEQQQIIFDHANVMSFKIPEGLQKGEICIMSKVAGKQEFLGWAQLQVDRLGEQKETIDEPFYNDQNQAVGSISLTSIETMKHIPSATKIEKQIREQNPNKDKRPSIENNIIPMKKDPEKPELILKPFEKGDFFKQADTKTKINFKYDL